MKRLLPVSILLNIALIASAIVLVLQTRSRIIRPDLLPPMDNTTVTETAVARNPPSAETHSPAPFRWQQLESTDYRIYIANLRAIGCPEQTIRDIISADVDALYASKRSELRRNLAGNERAARDEQSHREEADLLFTLLGKSPDEPSLSTKGFAPKRRTRTHDRVEVPLVLRNFDINALQLDPARAAIIAELRREFIDRIGGEAQDPYDPAYRKRWESAQPEVDEQLKASLGFKVYQELQAQGTGSP